MKRFGFVAVTIAMSIASSAVVYAARDSAGNAFWLGVLMAFISAILSIFTIEGS